MTQTVTREAIAGAVARGWCHPNNASKEMDSALAYAIVDEIEAALRAALDAPAAPQAVPPGWKLVPIEPTPEMLHAGVTAAVDQRNRNPWCPPCYRAMLAAAPSPKEPTK